jgi:hypothetical protein
VFLIPRVCFEEELSGLLMVDILALQPQSTAERTGYSNASVSLDSNCLHLNRAGGYFMGFSWIPENPSAPPWHYHKKHV